jgi:integrase
MDGRDLDDFGQDHCRQDKRAVAALSGGGAPGDAIFRATKSSSMADSVSCRAACGEKQKLRNSSKAGTHQLMAKLLYGTGLRLMECLRLRVKDLDFGQQQIVVRDGKGLDDRVTMLPASLVVPLQEHLSRVQCLHAQDVAQRVAPVS